ncbi:MAG: ShlB/FhaC/HecB family hemolysin secretion/activation protein [Phycisphaerales bacterium]|nr:ShlB/FhaC/HecB family hemolysin secretion/activation protein [Phycisphaerales bacterium]
MSERPRAKGPRCQRRMVWLALALGTVVPLAPAQESAPQPTAEAAPAGGAPSLPPVEPPKYPVSRFVIEYAKPNPHHPDPQEILESATVTLGVMAGGYVEPSVNVKGVNYPRTDISGTVTLRVSEFAEQPMQRFNAMALAAVVRAIYYSYKEHGLAGVVVDAGSDIYLPLRRDPESGLIELDTSDPKVGEDLRPEHRPDAPTELHLTVYTGVLSQVRTQAAGERIGKDEERINNPKHAWIREHSPVQAGSGDGGQDPLRKDEVDDYMARLSRHPGRRVDAAVSAGTEPGDIALDYIVNEAKPWTIYAQVSNTGTEETNEWRERFGFSNTQITGHDDILSLEYVTAGFKDTNAVLGSYERPLGDARNLHAKIYGNWNQYTASDVGQAGVNFEGDGYLLAAELSSNFYQDGPLFLDVFGGVRWQHVRVENPGATGDVVGETNFFVPYLGVRLDRRTDVESTFASVSVEGNVSSVTDEDELENLGRLDTSADWFALRGEVEHTFFLEPILNRTSWEDLENGSPTLAHEVALSLRGQYASNRLVPNYQQVIGGAYTVRGYTESVAAGDSMWVASVEYRWHVPWGLRYNPTPGTFMGHEFRWRPSQPYGRADWDLVLKAFVDVGQTFNSERKTFEDDETLAGAGPGLELAFRRNFSLRLDWGFALLDTEAGQVDEAGQFEPEVRAGDSRLHLTATIMY